MYFYHVIGPYIVTCKLGGHDCGRWKNMEECRGRNKTIFIAFRQLLISHSGVIAGCIG